ncbi:hypothetical protein MXB_3566 [Myxobolus squamalis]|nr:hypothetical protein MXB_3566 [Myxobolus squamalis]
MSLLHLEVPKQDAYVWSGNLPTRSYVYVLFENERSVKNLLYNCIQESSEMNGEYYFKIATSKTQIKNVQVIPWVISDSSHLTCFAERLDTSKTIFVGGLHGMMTSGYVQ